MQTVKIALSILISFSFVACSNMTIGLEEDSRFYDGPMYDNREDNVSKNMAPKKEKTLAEKKVEKKTPTKIVEPTIIEKIEEKPSEDESTFTYERDDE